MAMISDRNSLREAITAALDAGQAEGAPAVVLMKLTSIPTVNSRYGYEVADEIIAAAFDALQRLLRDPIRPFRVGGTRFGFIVPRVKFPALLRIGIERALNAVQGPFEAPCGSVNLKAVAGAATSPESGRTADELLVSAEFALQSAIQGDQQIVIHSARDARERHDHWLLEGDLVRALEEDQLAVHYQPQIRLNDFTAAGFEALLRWQHPERGWISPSVFIPLAERSSLINELTDWVMQNSLRQISSLCIPGQLTRVSVNVSPVTLFDPGFPYAIESALSLWGSTHEQLVLEVTEGTLVRDVPGSKRVLNALRDKGVTVSIDDFGTGYSSLAYFKELPVDEIKIDKSFITDLAAQDVDRKLVESIIGIGHKLGLEVVAEGVEESHSLDLLREYGCNIAQGYLISPPLEADGIDAWFNEALSSSGAASA